MILDPKPQRLFKYCYFLYEENGKSNKDFIIFDRGRLRKGLVETQGRYPPFFQSDRVLINPTEQSTLFGKIDIKKGEKNIVLHALKVVEPRLTGISTIVVNDTPILHGELENMERKIPLSNMGDGLARLTSLILYIINAPDSIVLIDEIENGFHYSILKDVWRVIDEASKPKNTQIFATTHSWECIVAAHNAFSESEKYDFALHRLDMVDDKIKAITYDQETLSASIEIGMDVR